MFLVTFACVSFCVQTQQLEEFQMNSAKNLVGV